MIVARVSEAIRGNANREVSPGCRYAHPGYACFVLQIEERYRFTDPLLYNPTSIPTDVFATLVVFSEVHTYAAG
jgi:hypothetical protein